MSTQAAPVVQTSTPFAFDDEKFKAKGQELRKEMEQYIGKHNHNPFIWINKNVIPLEEAYLKGDRTQATYDKMMALKSEAPKVDHRLLDTDVPKTASPQPSNVTTVGGGLQLPKK